MFFVAMSYSCMYGTLPDRVSACFWGMTNSEKLPMFNKNAVVRCLEEIPSP